MIKKIFNTITIACLSLLLLFGTTAKEYVHLFAHHEDTVHDPHHVCKKGEAHFEPLHHHCSFLHFILESFSNDAFIPSIAFLSSKYAHPQNSIVNSKAIPRSNNTITLRGPPTSVFATS